MITKPNDRKRFVYTIRSKYTKCAIMNAGKSPRGRYPRSTWRHDTMIKRSVVENHTQQPSPFLISWTFDIRKIQLKHPSAHFCRTPPGLPKRLPNEECFAPWNENKRNKRRPTRRQALKFAPARTPGHFLARLRSRAAIFCENSQFSNFEFRTYLRARFEYAESEFQH